MCVSYNFRQPLISFHFHMIVNIFWQALVTTAVNIKSQLCWSKHVYSLVQKVACKRFFFFHNWWRPKSEQKRENLYLHPSSGQKNKCSSCVMCASCVCTLIVFWDLGGFIGRIWWQWKTFFLRKLVILAHNFQNIRIPISFAYSKGSGSSSQRTSCSTDMFLQ